MLSLILLSANLLAFALILRHGCAWDRLAVLVIAVAICATPLVQGFQVGNSRVGVASVDMALFLSLWALCERADRWWLTAAAGFQLISLGTFVVPWMIPDTYLVWTGVTVRLLAWGLVSIALFAGAWETWAARRFAKEASNAETNLRRRSTALAPP